jgi:DNA-binding MarR family transcriptional regulator
VLKARQRPRERGSGAESDGRGIVSAEDQSLGDVLDFLQLVWALAHSLERASKHMRKTRGLTGPQRLVLRVTSRFPGVSAGELARILHLHPSTLTGVIKRLEERQLLERSTDPRDGRRALLRLSRAGRALDVRAPGTVEHAVERALDSSAPRDVRAAERVLTALVVALDAATDDSGPSGRRR